jgi:hypothetical protein
MRSYWLRIAAGAFGIFLVGMILIGGFRRVKTTVRHTIESNDPIPIPLVGLVPFRLDGEKLGSLDRVEFLRSDPEHISGVRVRVKLADSVEPSRLGQCALALDDLNNLNDKTTFRCQDTASPAPGLERFGVVAIRNGSDTFPLLLPGQAVAELRQTSFRLTRHGFEVKGPADAVAEALAARTDSMRNELNGRIDARSDSVDSLRELASSLEDSALEAAPAERRRLQRQSDSVRAVMRSLVVRLKADEERMKALDRVSGLTAAQRDSLARLSGVIRDSVQRALARELGRMQEELKRAGVQVQPAAPAAPDPAAPPRPR